MTKVLHVIQHLSLGGAARALVAMSKFSTRIGPFKHRVFSLIPPGPEAMDLARTAGIEVVPDHSRQAAFREMEIADIVQIHWWNSPQMALLLRAPLPPARVMLWYHVCGDAAPQGITAAVADLADLNVVSNPWTYDELPLFRLWSAADRAARLAMVIDPADFERLEGCQPRAHDGFNIGYIGTVDFFKMHRHFVRMSAAVQVPEARFIVCGGGRERELEEEARRLGAGDRFIFRGYVKDIRPVLEILDVYGYPLCEGTYASGELNLQEAMFAGVPPVVFPYGGVRQLIRHESNGLIVHSEREYQQAIEHLHQNPADRMRLGRNAAEYSRQFFGAENAARQLNPLYERMLGLPKRRRAWGARADRPILEQAITAGELLSASPPSGAELFIESLGEEGNDFRQSREAQDLSLAFEADSRVGAASPLIHYNGVVPYLVQFPQDPWLRMWAGLGCYHSGSFGDAAKHFVHSLQSGNPHRRTFWHCGLAAERATNRPLALRAIRDLLKVDPSFPNAQQKLEELEASGREEGSLPAEESRELPPSAKRCWEQARLFQSQGDVPAAREYLLRAIDLAPNEPALRGALAEIEATLNTVPPVNSPAPVTAPPHSSLVGSPLISVLVSTYNSERFLRACLEDLEGQTIATQIEILVIDSGSEQNEGNIAAEFEKRYGNIRYIRTERETLYAAWNRGIALARGRYIANANSDDSHRRDALEKLVAALEAHPEADLAYGDLFTTTAPNDSFERPQVLRRIAYGPLHPATAMFYCSTGCHPMWRRSVFDRLGSFDPTYTAPGDYEFLLRFIQAGLRAVHVPEVLSLYYQNPEGLGFQNARRSAAENQRLLAQYRASMPIHRLFQVNPAEPASAVVAWIALGNRALAHAAPWFENLQQDPAYAQFCFQQALQIDPRHPTALHNLAVTGLLQGHQVDGLLRLLPQALVSRLQNCVAHGRLQLLPANPPPASAPIEFSSANDGEEIRGSEPTHGQSHDVIGSTNASLLSNKAESPPPAAAAIAPVAIRWSASFLTLSGESEDARNLLIPLAGELGIGMIDESTPRSEALADSLPREVSKVLEQSRAGTPLMLGGIGLVHRPPARLTRLRDAVWQIARTSHETDRLNPESVRACNQMDELWVPNSFCLETFAASGVDREKLWVVPSSLDTRRFDPARVVALPLAKRAACNFLAVFTWTAREGWDKLLAAYLAEFRAEDDVCLHLHVALPGKTNGDSREPIEAQIRDFARQRKLDPAKLPAIHILAEPLSWAAMPQLFRAVDCLVAPHRGAAAWSRTILEAMAMELPVIATQWGGPAEFLTESTGFPIRSELSDTLDLLPDEWAFHGQRWADPSLDHLRQCMRQVASDPAAAKVRGTAARKVVQEKFNATTVTRQVLLRLRDIADRLTRPTLSPTPRIAIAVPNLLVSRKTSNPQLVVALEGAFLDHGSLAHVNRELSRQLARRPGIQLTCVGRNVLPPEASGDLALVETARRLKFPAPANTQITIRHGWPPNWEPPARGSWVVIQPWEYGVVPVDWVSQLARVDQLWVPSQYARRCYVDSGVDLSRVQVVPNGIDPERFHPDAPPQALGTRKRFKFLFVGGTIHRKGPDILLRAFLETFRAKDEVCLVIKDFGGQGAYAGQTHEAQIRAAQNQSNAPEILYLNEQLAEKDIAGLYTACDCLVHPYRGEGFGLPVLEAMACGLPVIVTGGGATDDFAADHLAFRLPALRRSIAGEVSGMKLVRPGWMLEPDLAALKFTLHEIYLCPEPARARGLAASREVRANWTWERAALIAHRRLEELQDGVASRRKPVSLTSRARAIDIPAVARVGQLSAATAQFGARDLLGAWHSVIEALNQRPFHPEGWLLLAEIAQAAGDGVRAKKFARHASEIAPGWKPARQFLKAPVRPPTISALLPELPHKLSIEPGRKPLLSVFLITKNEERFIGRCLESVREIADQIVVVDTGSSDWTREIAERFGAEVLQFDWCDDFSAARNVALQKVTGDWVLMLDADEELPADQQVKLQRLLEVRTTIAWRLPMIDEGHESAGKSYVPRLFRNAPGLFYIGRVHEQVFSSLEVRRREWGLENRIGDANLVHHGYTREMVRSRDKIARNLRLLQRALVELPDEANLVMNLGLELTRAGETEAGLAQYRRAFQLLAAQPSDEVTPELRETLLTQFTSHLMPAKQFAEIVSVLTSPLARRDGLTASMHFTLGLAQIELRHYSEGAEQMRQCVKMRSRPALSPINAEIQRAGPNHCLGLCLAALQQTEQAEAAFLSALQDEPQSRLVRFDLARLHGEHGKPLEALHLLHQLVSESPGESRVWEFGGRLALSFPEFIQFASDWTGEAIKYFPVESILIEQRAQALLLAGRPPEALNFWRKLAASGKPNHLAALLICEVVSGQPIRPSALFQRAALESEFLQWYRRLIQYNAGEVIGALNAQLPALRTILPGAIATLDAALTEAG